MKVSARAMAHRTDTSSWRKGLPRSARAGGGSACCACSLCRWHLSRLTRNRRRQPRARTPGSTWPPRLGRETALPGSGEAAYLRPQGQHAQLCSYRAARGLRCSAPAPAPSRCDSPYIDVEPTKKPLLRAGGRRPASSLFRSRLIRLRAPSVFATLLMRSPICGPCASSARKG